MFVILFIISFLLNIVLLIFLYKCYTKLEDKDFIVDNSDFKDFDKEESIDIYKVNKEVIHDDFKKNSCEKSFINPFFDN